MKEGIRDGVVQPLPRTLFAKTEVEKAFRYMAKGKHIGKILVEVSFNEQSILWLKSLTKGELLTL